MSVRSGPANARRVAAGRANRGKRGPLSEEGRQRLREAALRGKPWLYASGPRTAEGKARSAANGRYRQRGPQSVRQARAEAAEVWSLIRQMDATCRGLESP